jgi:hypothetical protein
MHLIAPLMKTPDKVSPNEACGAGDQNPVLQGSPASKFSRNGDSKSSNRGIA